MTNRKAKRTKRTKSHVLDQINLAKNALRLLYWQLRPPSVPVLRSQPDRQFDVLFHSSCDQFTSILQPFIDECRWPLREVYNGLFEAIDAEFYYCAVRAWRPKTIIEIGSGWATRFASRALAKNGRGQIVSIDPEPRCALPAQISHIQSRVEEVDLDVFDQLGMDDILFIDSSHTMQEAEYHTTRIFERLKPGVFIHHHDILYPYQPRLDEEPVVLDFYYRHQESFAILAGLAFVRHTCPDMCLSLVPSYRRVTNRVPGSLWTRRKIE